MKHAILMPDEISNVERGPWFSTLPPQLRQAIFDKAIARRFPDGVVLGLRGEPSHYWYGVAGGACQVSSRTLSGKRTILTYLEPGTWFGDISLVDGLPHTHDGVTHGDTTLLMVRRDDFKDLLVEHAELYEALLRLNCCRLRLQFDAFEDLNTLPLASRLAKQILLLACSHGIEEGREVRIGLSLAQEDLGHLVGASRQRVNIELKRLERDGAIRVEPTRVSVLSREKLLATAERD